jgi:hypothetical protein
MRLRWQCQSNSASLPDTIGGAQLHTIGSTITVRVLLAQGDCPLQAGCGKILAKNVELSTTTDIGVTGPGPHSALWTRVGHRQAVGDARRKLGQGGRFADTTGHGQGTNDGKKRWIAEPKHGSG